MCSSVIYLRDAIGSLCGSTTHCQLIHGVGNASLQSCSSVELISATLSSEDSAKSSMVNLLSFIPENRVPKNTRAASRFYRGLFGEFINHI